MTDTQPEPQPSSESSDRPSSESSDRPAPDPALAGAGLSATGRTAADFVPGEEGSGTAYGAPGGTGAEDAETTGPASEAGATADGDAEGG